ncbi:MAG: type II secretion system F family protein [Treponema sp.]|nr:type II secretion system F family protein [Treponema sp.]
MKENYRCVVWENNGRKSVVFRSAQSEDELIRSFSSESQSLLSYKKIRSAKGKHSQTSKSAVLSFTESIAALLSSGLSVQDSISVCARITDRKAVANLCASLSRSLSEGRALSEALSLHGTFPSVYIPLIRIGEATGSVAEVFSRLTDYLRTKKELSRKLASSLAYPATVCVTAVLVVLCMVLFVFPKLSAVFEVFSSESPALEDKIGSIRITFTITGMIFVFIILSIAVGMVLRKISDSFAEKSDKILISIPLLSKYIKISETNDFAFAMELLCSSGMSLVSALEQSALVIRNSAYRKAVFSVAEDVRNGSDVAESMRKHKEFPTYIVTWLGIGEATGSVEKSFSQIRSYYEKELSSILSTLAASAEPAFILAAGIVIFILVGQIVLPIFSMLGEL